MSHYSANNNSNFRQSTQTVKFSARLTARIRLSETNRCLSSHDPNSITSTHNQSTYVQFIPTHVIREQHDDDVIRDRERDENVLTSVNGNTVLLTTARSSIPLDTRHAHRPLFIDPLARLFGGSGAVSSLYDHTHFLYRKMYDNWNVFSLKIYPSLAKKMTLLFLAHHYESRRLSYHRQAMPYIQVRTRVYDDVISHWAETTRELIREEAQHSSSSQKKPHMQAVLIGAGFDSRALRLPSLYDVDVYEIDQLEVLDYKQSLFDLTSEKNTSKPCGESVSTSINEDNKHSITPNCHCSICMMHKYKNKLTFIQSFSSGHGECIEDASTNMSTTWPPQYLCHNIHRLVGNIATKTNIMTTHLYLTNTASQQKYCSPSKSRQNTDSTDKQCNVEIDLYPFNINVTLSNKLLKTNQQRYDAATIPSHLHVTIPLIQPRSFTTQIYHIIKDSVLFSKLQLPEDNETVTTFHHLLEYLRHTPLQITEIIANNSSIENAQIAEDLPLQQLSYLISLNTYHRSVMNIPTLHKSTPFDRDLNSFITQLTTPSTTTAIMPLIEALSTLITSERTIFQTKYTTPLAYFSELQDPLVYLAQHVYPRINWVCNLLQTGFCSTKPTLFAVEGVFMYITAPQVKETLAFIQQLATAHPESALVADQYTAYAGLSGTSYYSLFKSGFPIHDKMWLFPQLFSSQQKACINTHEPTLMKVLYDTGFSQAKIGILKNQCYIDYRVQDVFVDDCNYNYESNDCQCQAMQIVSQSNNEMGTNEVKNLVLTKESKISEIVSDKPLLSVEYNAANSKILTPHTKNPLISDLQLHKHPLSILIENPTPTSANLTENTHPTTPLYTTQYRINNALVSIPSSYNYLTNTRLTPPNTPISKTSELATNDIIQHPVCTTHYHDANIFLHSPFFDLSNYVECKYIFPYSTSQYNDIIYPLYSNVLSLSDNVNINETQQIQQMQDTSITTQMTRYLQQLISQQTPYISSQCEADRLTQLPSNDESFENTFHQRNDKLSLLKQYPPVFSLTYNAFPANNQHECEPALPTHSLTCNKFKQKSAHRTFFNPLILFYLYLFLLNDDTTNNLSDEKRDYLKNILQKHHINDKHGVIEQLSQIIDNDEIYIDILNLINSSLIDISLECELDKLMVGATQSSTHNKKNTQEHKKTHINDGNYGNTNSPNSAEVVIDNLSNTMITSNQIKKSKPTTDDAQSNKKPTLKQAFHTCKCTPCPDMVEYYIFISKP